MTVALAGSELRRLLFGIQHINCKCHQMFYSHISLVTSGGSSGLEEPPILAGFSLELL